MADSYGKRPLWQWIVLYVIIGGLVYGLVYYFIVAKNVGGYGAGGTDNYYGAPQNAEPTPESGT